MSSQTLQGTPASADFPYVECRVWERFPCGLQTTCQPLAARGDNEISWPAQIRDLSQGGVGVVLTRRYEPGAALAIEIPESDTVTTLMGKVVHTTSLPGRLWLHGCAFVSPLSEDEVQRLLCLGQSGSNSVQDEAPTHLIEEVMLEGLEGNYPRRLIRRLQIKGTWPPAPGTVLKVRLGKALDDHANVIIERCVQEAGRWVLFYTFIDSPSTEIRRAFGYQEV
jgi:hypothetical protein